MKPENAIEVTHLSKVFPLQHTCKDENGNEIREHWALKDISFEIKKGESVGIIGPNGSGKSTLLKILAGVTKPTSGSVKIKGKVASILDIGAGFHPELSGRENVFLNGQIHGFSKKEIESKFDEIVAFSGIEKFIDEPVKNYSSGMYLRLAFSIMAHLDFDVYLFDEVLNVGDIGFALKSKEKINNLVLYNKTVAVVSHNIYEIQGQERLINIEKGTLLNVLSKNDVLTQYTKEAIIDINQIVYTKNVKIEDFTRYPENNMVELLKLELKQDGYNIDFSSSKPFKLIIECSKFNEMDDIDVFVVISDIGGMPILTTSPIISEEGLWKNKETSFVCEIPASIFGFQIYKIGLFFVNYKKRLLNKEKVFLKSSDISNIKKTIIRFDSLILFKMDFNFKETNIILEEVNIGSGLMPAFKWYELT